MQKKVVGKKRLSKLPIIAVLGIIALLFGFAVLLFFRSRFSNITKEKQVSFKEFLSTRCRAQANNLQRPKEFNVSDLPLVLPIEDLTKEKAICGAYDSYVFIPLGDEEASGYESTRFITLSDNDSEYCCHTPSDIEPAGKYIGLVDGIQMYIHTGHWSEGPNPNYKPVFARGIRQLELSSKEKIRIVMDRIAIGEDDKNLQELEDKYKVIDSNFNSGKYVFTPEVVEEMLEDNFFADIRDNPIVSKIASELNSITAK